jgi:hypothetical protein
MTTTEERLFWRDNYLCGASFDILSSLLLSVLYCQTIK